MLYEPNIVDKIASLIYSFFTLPFIKDKSLTFSDHYNDQLIYTTIEKSYKDLHIKSIFDQSNDNNHKQTQNLVQNHSYQATQNLVLTEIKKLSNYGKENLKNIVSETIKPIFILSIAHTGHADVILEIYPNINDTDIAKANQAFGGNSYVEIKKTTEGLEILDRNSGRQIESATLPETRLTKHTESAPSSQFQSTQSATSDEPRSTTNSPQG